MSDMNTAYKRLEAALITLEDSIQNIQTQTDSSELEEQVVNEKKQNQLLKDELKVLSEQLNDVVNIISLKQEVA